MLTAQQFIKAAGQRFTAAEWLLDEHPLDAFYIVGYSVECAFKALAMHLTPVANQSQMFDRLKGGAKMHYPEQLKEIVKQQGHLVPPPLIKGLRRFEWTIDLRYETGRRPVHEVRGYLKVAKQVIAWVQGEMK